MKTLNIHSFLIAILLLFSVTSMYAQRVHGGGKVHPRVGHGAPHTKVVVKAPHRAKNVVVVKSKYRPHNVVVFHPYWAPAVVCHRRWVFFPRYNFYWDNWRNVYFFWNGTIWVSQLKPPAVVVNINMEKEKHYELKENEDDLDDIYQSNESHKTEYKPE